MWQETQSILSAFLGLFQLTAVPTGNFGMSFKVIGVNLLS
jgi:hypothetical protein